MQASNKMTGDKITKKIEASQANTNNRCVAWTCLVVGSMMAVFYPWFHATYMCETVYQSTKDWIEYMREDVIPSKHIEDGTVGDVGEPNYERDQFVTVEALLSRIKIPTLQNEITKHSKISNPDDPLIGLKSWKKVNKKWLHIPINNFSVFLPPLTFNNTLGQVYEIVKVRKKNEGTDSKVLSSQRHFPPTIDEKYSTIQNLLSMFHRNVFIVTRFLPSGGVAIVRAKNEKYFEIVFRLHAEFQLNKHSNVPLWFTPAQFTGSLVISHDLQQIQYFKMYVPTKRRLNIDLEWIDTKRGLQADIGYIPVMSLQMTSPSVSSAEANKAKKLPEHQDDKHNMIWSEEIPVDEANRLMEREMYPFKQVLTQKTFSEPVLSKVALRLLKHFEPPVTMMLTKPDGSVVHKVVANTFFQTLVNGQHRELSSSEAYQIFLKEGLSKLSKEN